MIEFGKMLRDNEDSMNNKTKTEDPINYYWISRVVDHYLPVALFVGGFMAGLIVGIFLQAFI